MGKDRIISKKKVFARIGISLATLIMIAVLGILGVVLIVEFGPSKTARNLFINSAMESSAGKFLATLFFSDEKIAEIRNSNSVMQTDDVTDTSLIHIAKDDEMSDTKTVEEKKDIEIVDISGDTYSGILMKIKDPSRVCVGVSGNYGSDKSGKTVSQIAQSYNAVAATNAGGFEDKNGMGLGGTPVGLVISESALKYGSPENSYEVIGFNKDNILVVGRMTAKKALDMGVRDAVSFGPILIVNGEAMEVSGTGSGLNPRTAIGQCKDGTVLLLVIDGRQVNSLGATYADVIEVLLKNGAVNAANLDGGSSSLMYYEGEYINSCASLYGPRALPTAIIVK